jgi:hypothetical protein
MRSRKLVNLHKLIICYLFSLSKYDFSQIFPIFYFYNFIYYSSYVNLLKNITNYETE